MINNKNKKLNKKLKENDTLVVVLLLVLLFTSFFIFLYMQRIKDDIKNTVVINGKNIKLDNAKDIRMTDFYHKNYMDGYADNTFRPNQNITRGEVANIIANIDNVYDDKKKYYSSYSDELGIYENAISFCAEYGIMSGTTEGTFMQDSYITRQEFLNVLARYKKFKESLVDVNLNEAKKDWYDTYTKLISSEKVKDEDGKAVDSLITYVTRAEACSIINRTFNRELTIDAKLLNVIEKDGWYNDIDYEDWYFEDVIEATKSHIASEYHKEEYEGNNLKYNYPNNYYIDFKTNLLQNPELPTGCEITALTQLLNYYGYQIDKVMMSDRYLAKVPVGESDFLKEFVGNPRTNAGFGCYAEAIKDAAQRYLSETYGNKKVLNLTGYKIDEIYEIVSKGYPVNVWVTTNLIKSNKNFVWKYKDRNIYWTLNEHCVTLIGYDKEKAIVYVADPLNGLVSCDMSTFEYRYKELGEQALVIADDKLNITERSQEVTKINFTNGVNTMYVGNVHEMNIIVEPPYSQNSDIDWISSDANIISVSNRGIISANGKGTATVSAVSTNGVNAKIDIEVK